jgi:hypothetical protein
MIGRKENKGRKQEQTYKRTRNNIILRHYIEKDGKKTKGTNQKETVLIERNKMPYTNAFLKLKDTIFS